MTLDGIDYFYEDNMTWGEWLESEYNTDGFLIVTGFRYIGETARYPNMKFIMNATKDKYIACPDSNGNYSMHISQPIQSYDGWALYLISDLGMEPIE